MSRTEPAGQTITWYRCPLTREQLEFLNGKSDVQACVQTLGYLGILACTGALAWYSSLHWGIAATVGLVFLHGMGYAFQINAVHDLGHRTVFRSRAVNSAFEHLFAFMGWINHRMFWNSHLRHHRFTLHPPDDLEVVLPIKGLLRGFWKAGFINCHGFVWSLKNALRVAQGRFAGEWENKLYPAEDRAKRQAAITWARTILVGHLLIMAVSIYFRWWMLPLLTTFAPFYGGWLQYLVNNVQHAGLQDNVPDFRLCCRTVYVNPVVRFLYWQMNYHTEHHMYPGVPCYRLRALHRAIREEMPPTKGLIGAWREIRQIELEQQRDPQYQYVMPVPPAPPAQRK